MPQGVYHCAFDVLSLPVCTSNNRWIMLLWLPFAPSCSRKHTSVSLFMLISTTQFWHGQTRKQSVVSNVILCCMPGLLLGGLAVLTILWSGNPKCPSVVLSTITHSRHRFATQASLLAQVLA